MAFLDVFEEGINEFVVKRLKNFFDKNKFVPVNKEAKGMGAVAFYANPDLLVRVVNDRGQFMIGIGNAKSKICWDIDFIKSFFKISDYKIDVDDKVNRRRALFETFKSEDYSSMILFLNTNMSRITKMFSQSECGNTNSELEKLSVEKQQFRMEG